MCMICAAIPATAALGAKLNADPLYQLPIPKITGRAIGSPMLASTLDCIIRWQS